MPTLKYIHPPQAGEQIYGAISDLVTNNNDLCPIFERIAKLEQQMDTVIQLLSKIAGEEIK